LAIQIHHYWSAVLDVIDEDNDFAVDGREALRSMVNENPLLLRLEMALIADVGKPLIDFCYFREGDGFLAPTTWDHWQSMVKEVQHVTGNNSICPCVEDVIEQMFVGAPNEMILLRETSISKGRKVLEKLNQDGSGGVWGTDEVPTDPIHDWGRTHFM
jgi:hypothetical protein